VCILLVPGPSSLPASLTGLHFILIVGMQKKNPVLDLSGLPSAEAPCQAQLQPNIRSQLLELSLLSRKFSGSVVRRRRIAYMRGVTALGWGTTWTVLKVPRKTKSA